MLFCGRERPLLGGAHSTNILPCITAPTNLLPRDDPTTPGRSFSDAHGLAAHVDADPAEGGHRQDAHVVALLLLSQGVVWTWDTPVIKAGRTVVKKTGEGERALMVWESGV